MFKTISHRQKPIKWDNLYTYKLQVTEGQKISCFSDSTLFFIKSQRKKKHYHKTYVFDSYTL